MVWLQLKYEAYLPSVAISLMAARVLVLKRKAGCAYYTQKAFQLPGDQLPL